MTGHDDHHFRDVSGGPTPGEPDYWQPVIFRSEEIAAEAGRLASLPPPDSGRRESLFVHPRSEPDAPALAPGIRVTLAVLLPGERTRPIRHTSTEVGFCIAGRGQVVVGGERIEFGRFDAWNHPAWRTYWYENTGDEPLVRLAYSNAPLLERLNVHLVEDRDEGDGHEGDGHEGDGHEGDGHEGDGHEGDGHEGDGHDVHGDEPAALAASPAAETAFALEGGRAMLMPYETLINPPPVRSDPLHWPWSEVKGHLDRLDALGDRYVGRRLYLLYNPLTGRTNGTTPSFFATICVRPPGIVDRPHRHVSAAINYFFHGSGWSRIGGRRYEWAAGDLMLTAPGWMIHHHASNDADRVYELTVQDQPLHIATESLLWQEDLKRPARVLGSEVGFVTNR